MLKFVFELAIEPLGLPIEWYWEWLILSIIGYISYKVAFSKVGQMYHDKTITGRGIGSIIHWIIRLICFVIIWAITYGVIWLIKVIIRYRKIIEWSLLAIIIIAIFIKVFVIVRRRRHGINNP
ncbi:MAG: hypothetical protein U0L59_01335 [Faecalimonas sp.]|nr:hypothetical protein [Faecalimonas sp.]